MQLSSVYIDAFRRGIFGHTGLGLLLDEGVQTNVSQPFPSTDKKPEYEPAVVAVVFNKFQVQQAK